MQLEVGKYYKTRDGRKVGPIRSYKDYDGQYHWDDSIDHIAIDSLKFHAADTSEPLEKEAFRIVLRYYGVVL